MAVHWSYESRTASYVRCRDGVVLVCLGIAVFSVVGLLMGILIHTGCK